MKKVDDEKVNLASLSALRTYYRRKKRELAKAERRFIDTPTNEAGEQVAELAGFVRGIWHAIGVIHERMEQPELPLAPPREENDAQQSFDHSPQSASA